MRANMANTNKVPGVIVMHLLPTLWACDSHDAHQGSKTPLRNIQTHPLNGAPARDESRTGAFWPLTARIKRKVLRPIRIWRTLRQRPPDASIQSLFPMPLRPPT